ncbi:hypothetical protein [Snuella sedimenti]|uniref:Uncharacterized protein n=1 Tax=Snuella sedimenti TaxID=2798802 RepID=A0A8J7LPA4_9FLAO|nr:hypothetical protein [Snuella sedimenti]MBJ6369073.1 hypothetical protein [Snuella sedimenti]
MTPVLQIKKQILQLTFIVISLFSVQQIEACRYTVREIGYSDLGECQFQLYMFVPEGFDGEVIKTFKQLGYATFLDTNIAFHVIDVSANPEDKRVRYLKDHKLLRDRPMLMLVSPLEKTKLITLEDDFSKEAIWEVFERVINSDLQRKLSKDLVDSYAVVLLLHGDNDTENRRVRREVDKAVADIKQVMPAMAKKVDLPIKIYELSLKDRLEEQLLLWSTGIPIDDRSSKVISVFGRGRMMGQPLADSAITRERLFKQLSIVGADCECGLDRKWLLGTILPLRWSAENKQNVANALGFDVENPIVKSEMSQIMSIDLRLIDDISQTPYLNSLERIKENPVAKEEPSTPNSNKVIWYSLSGLILVVLIASLKIIRKK